MRASRLLTAAPCFGSLLASCTSPAPDPGDAEAEAAALNAALESFAAAAMSGDIEAAAAYLADDFEPRTEDYFLHGDVAYEGGE